MNKKYFVGYIPDADLLEVMFNKEGGYYQTVGDGPIMLRYDENEELVGFAIDGLSNIGPGIEVELVAKASEIAEAQIER